MNSTKIYYQSEIKRIEEKYPKSMMMPPLLCVIEYVDDNGSVLSEEVMGDMEKEMREYEKIAKQSHETVSRILERDQKIQDATE